MPDSTTIQGSLSPFIELQPGQWIEAQWKRENSVASSSSIKWEFYFNDVMFEVIAEQQFPKKMNLGFHWIKETTKLPIKAKKLTESIYEARLTENWIYQGKEGKTEFHLEIDLNRMIIRMAVQKGGQFH